MDCHNKHMTTPQQTVPPTFVISKKRKHQGTLQIGPTFSYVYISKPRRYKKTYKHTHTTTNTWMSFISLKLQENYLPVQLPQLSETRRPQRCRHLHVMADPVGGWRIKVGKDSKVYWGDMNYPNPWATGGVHTRRITPEKWPSQKVWKDSLLTIIFQGRAVKLWGVDPFLDSVGEMSFFLGEWWKIVFKPGSCYA